MYLPMEGMLQFHSQIFGKVPREETLRKCNLFKQNGSIFDPQSGVSDLKKEKIKFIGNPEKGSRRLFENFKIY